MSTAFVTTLTTHDQIGFELGWDYAHHGIPPATPYAEGLRRCSMACAPARQPGTRTLLPTRHVRKWLQLRLHAWLRGRGVELLQVTPNHLQQIEASHCPITRMALSTATLEASDASVDRVRNDAGYAAGNLGDDVHQGQPCEGGERLPRRVRILRDLEAGFAGRRG